MWDTDGIPRRNTGVSPVLSFKYSYQFLMGKKIQSKDDKALFVSQQEASGVFQEQKLPVVLSQGEVFHILSSVSNIKHKAILMLSYRSFITP